LYNLKDDLGEQHNLAAGQPKKVVESHEKLKTWRAAVGARMPSPNPNRKAGDREGGIFSFVADDRPTTEYERLEREGVHGQTGD
jgi:hypothetical protein